MTGLLLLLLGGLAATAWWQLLRGRERARAAAARTCHEHGLLLIDDTVVLDAIRCGRERGMPQCGLCYRFEFAHEGRRHLGGTVLVTARGRTTVTIPTRSGRVIEEF